MVEYSFVESMPVTNRGLNKDTLEVISVINSSHGRIIRFDFSSDKDVGRYYQRLLGARNKKIVSFKKLFRSKKALYVDTR